MKALGRRLEKLEEQFGCGRERGLVSIVMRAGQRWPLDSDTCLRILEECGHLDRRRPYTVVDFLDMPDDVDAQEIERILREHGAELTGLKPADPTKWLVSGSKPPRLDSNS